MKKIYFALAVLGAAAFVSCVQDIEDNNNPSTSLAKNTLAFKVSTGAATRADDATTGSTRGVTIPLGSVANGPSFSMEETVIDLDMTAPITRGTPVFTENAGVLYKNNMGVYSPDGSFGDATLDNMDAAQISEGGWRYQHVYASDPWPTGTARFYLRMPATQTGVTNGAYTYPADGKISFEYTSPATAAAQQDIIFAYTELTKAEHNGYLPNGAPVLFNHALTGIKFAIGNDKDEISYNADDNKIAIKEISFKGLKDHGTCVITPAASGTHVSATAAVWDPNALTTTLDSLSSGTFADTVMFSKGGSFGENGGSYPDSFVSEKTGLHNLNDAAGTQTFWLIPQVISADVQLTIKYTFAGTENYWVIDLGSILEGVNWQAGQLRTYTIKVDDVNVMIDDHVTMATGDAIVGATKNNIAITNTGNTDVFIRAAIVGQWLDSQNNVVFGFTDEINKLYSVESWYEDQFVNHTGEHGVFDNLPGYKNNNTQWPRNYGNELNDWVYNPVDKYYYYKNSVAPGAETGSPLFTSYTVKKIPEATNAGTLLTVEMYFTLEIATQAISARNLDGTLMTDYQAAWTAALNGEKPQI